MIGLLIIRLGFFSGAGFAIIGAVISLIRILFKRRRTQAQQELTSRDNSIGFQVGGNVEGHITVIKEDSIRRKETDEQDTTKRVPRMLSFNPDELIPHSIRCLGISILNLPELLNFLGSGEFDKLCTIHDVDWLWKYLKRAIPKATDVNIQIEDIFYHFIYWLFTENRPLEFIDDFKNKYTKEHPDADFTEVESAIMNLKRDTLPEPPGRLEDCYPVKKIYG